MDGALGGLTEDALGDEAGEMLRDELDGGEADDPLDAASVGLTKYWKISNMNQPTRPRMTYCVLPSGADPPTQGVSTTATFEEPL